MFNKKLKNMKIETAHKIWNMLFEYGNIGEDTYLNMLEELEIIEINDDGDIKGGDNCWPGLDELFQAVRKSCINDNKRYKFRNTQYPKVRSC